MRTLKKALSLVLVLAMVFTLAVPALAVDKASEFKDYDKVTNKEAVDVLTAIGVINGNADGTFGADAKFTRAQGATMIAYLTLGKTVADALPTSATKFSDVPANFWGAKYIQYCADEGIINGYGNGKFGPDDELTSAQWALMLLGALGYSSKNEGIGGTGWEIAATRLAMKAGVASADDMVGTMTRDTAAKMAFNTLKADLVEYQSNGTNITIGDTNINVGATKAEPLTTKDEKTQTIKKETATNGDYIVQFAEQHFPKLRLADATGTVDAFDRPAATWTNGATKVGTYSKSADLTYTTEVKGSDIYKDLGLTTAMQTGIEYFVNGKQTGVAGFDALSKNATWKVGGNGTLTEVYKTTNDQGVVTKVTIVEVQTFFGKVSAVTKATSTTERYVSVDGMKFETESFAKDDYVLYTKAETSTGVYAIQSMKAVVSAATGTITYVNTTNNTFVVGGETYKYSATNTERSSVGATATLYLDDYGYVIKDTGAQETTNYAVVVAKNDDYAGGIFDKKKMVKLVLTDGNTVEAEYDGTGIDVNDVVTYTVENDVYKLVEVADLDNGITAITTNNSTLKANVYADSKTVFVVRSGEGTTANPYTYKVHTGIANVPSMTSVTAKAAVKNFHAEVVYVTSAVETGVTSAKATYITEVGAQQVSEYAPDGKTKITYFLQNAVVDGEITTVKSSTKLNGVYSAVVTNSNGVITSATPASTADGLNDAVIEYVNGVVSINGGFMGYTSDAVCYIVDAKTGAIAASSIEGLSNDGTKYDGFFTTKDGIVVGLYLVPVVQ